MTASEPKAAQDASPPHDARSAPIRLSSTQFVQRPDMAQSLTPGRYAELFETVGDALIIVDEQRRMVEINAEAQRIFGYGSEILGQPVEILIPEDEREAERHRRPATERREVRGRRKDGSAFDTEISIARIEISAAPYFMVVVRDVSDRKQLEHELSESNRHLRQAQQLAGLGSWEHNVVTGKVKWSPQIYEMFGVDPDTEEPSAELFFTKLNPEDRETLRRQFARAQANRETMLSADIRILCPDGRERVLHELSELVWSEDGKLIRQIGTLLDVTEQRAADDRLRQSERLLHRSQELAQIGSWEYDVAKDRIGWSRHFFSLLGLDPDTTAPSFDLYESFVHPDDKGIVARRYADVREKRIGNTSSFTRIIRSDGVQRTLENTVEYHWSEDGVLLRMDGTSQDVTEQLAVAEQLRHREALLNRAQELAKVGSWEYLPGTEEVNWSPYFFRIMGLDPATDTPSFALYEKHIHPDDRDENRRRFQEMLGRRALSTTYNMRIVRRDGVERTLRTTVEYFWSDTGELQRMYATSQDITEQLQAAQRLEHSERLLNRAQELAQIGSWEYDSVTQEMNWSRNLFVILGLDPATTEPSFATYESVIHPDDLAIVRQQYGSVLTSHPQNLQFDARIRHSDGAERTLRTTVEYSWSESGELLRINGSSQDITEQLASAERLRTSERLLNRAQELAHTGSWEHNEITGEINWSRHFFRVLGFDPDVDPPSFELFMSAIHPEDEHIVRGRYEAALRDKIKFATYDTRIVRRDGIERTLRNTVEYFQDENGALLRINGSSQDITEQLATELALKKALAAARAADRAKSEFVANMSHELRTPLNAIIGFADILASEKHSPNTNARDREYAEVIRDSGNHLLEIINEVLDFSRMEAGSTDIRDEKIDTALLFAWVVKLLSEKAQQKKLTLTTAVGPDAGWFRGDLRLIRQALLNLAGNSVKFTLAGEIALKAHRARNNDLVITVRDTGIGMRPEDIPSALTPFTLLENSLQRQYQGVGLGFPLAKRFVELHGGRFEVESEQDKGTTVTIILPAWRCDGLEDE